MKFRHHGHAGFDMARFRAVGNEPFFNKPRGGLWGSPLENGTDEWEQWCKSENFGTGRLEPHFDFGFVVGTQAYTIDNLDAEKLFHRFEVPSSFGPLTSGIDFERMSLEYDAVILTSRGQRATRLSDPVGLYGWDVASVLVMNPRVIVATQEG